MSSLDIYELMQSSLFLFNYTVIVLRTRSTLLTSGKLKNRTLNIERPTSNFE